MIRCDFGKVHMKGSIPMLLSETEEVIMAMKNALIQELGKEDGMDAFKFLIENCNKNEEELRKQGEEAMNELSKEEALKEVLNDLKKLLKETIDNE